MGEKAGGRHPGVQCHWGTKSQNFSSHIKVDNLSVERTSREFQVNGSQTENAHENKLLVMLDGLVRRFGSEECKGLHGR